MQRTCNQCGKRFESEYAHRRYCTICRPPVQKSSQGEVRETSTLEGSVVSKGFSRKVSLTQGKIEIPAYRKPPVTLTKRVLDQGRAKLAEKLAKKKAERVEEAIVEEKNVVLEVMDKEFASIRDLFVTKSGAYGVQGDPFYNFRYTAQRLFGESSIDAMFKVAEVYKDKHNIALAKGANVMEVKERLRDNIVYSLIQLAMLGQEE